MGIIAKLLSFVRGVRGNANLTDVKYDAGGGHTAIGEHFSSPGDDSCPLAGDFVAAIRTKRGHSFLVGYIDPANEQTAQPGEKRVYARDANGAAVVEVWLKANGSCEISNALGSIELQATGTVVINGVIIDPLGNITTTGVVTAGSFVPP